MNYVYVLKSELDGRLYIGQTNNVEKRLIYHNSGWVKSTRNRRPLKILYKE
ncbi:GIY-YIG nuclease family protein, partial [Patescibacteria group bacterium]|nr:GIY-YIG nuclease family protein [Patescibacteria group bacterium]